MNQLHSNCTIDHAAAPLYWADELESARALHLEGHQREALCKLSELIQDVADVTQEQPWLLFDMLSLKAHVLCALELEDRASSLALTTWKNLNTRLRPARP